jgi:hypothetical protein
MTQGGRRTRGHPHDMGVMTGGQLDGGNLAGVATRKGAEEDLGEKAPMGGPRPSALAAW